MNDPTSLQPGTPFEGGFYGGQIRIGNAVFAIAWAPKAEGETQGAWLGSYTDVPGAGSCFDSMANTVAMAEAGSAIGNWARGLTIGGHTDWCVPARDVLELGYRLLKPSTQGNACSFRDGDNASSVPAGYPYSEATPAQTTAEAFRAGGAERSLRAGTGRARSTRPTSPSTSTSTTATSTTAPRSSRPKCEPSA